MNKNIFFAILAMLVVILIYSSSQYQKRFGRPLPPKRFVEKTEADRPETTRAVRRRAVDTYDIRSSQPREQVSAQTDTENVDVQVNAPSSEKEVILENEDIQIVFSSIGGVITKAVLKKFNGPIEGDPVQLIVEGESWVDGSIVDGDLSINHKALNFSTKSVTSKHVIFTAELNGNKSITKEFSIEPSGYMLKLKTNLSGSWDNPLLHFSWHGPINQTETPHKQLRIWPFSLMMRNENVRFTKMVYIGQGDRITIDVRGNEDTERIYTKDGGQKIDANKRGEGEDHFIGDIEWYAIRSKYFMTAAVPVDKKRWQAQSHYSSNGNDKWFDFTLSKYASEGNSDLDIYMGPIQYDTLKAYGNNLTESMELSFRIIRPISILFLWLFKKLHIFISNWGLVLIAFSLIIKIVLYPLSRTSFRSMRKMSTLQPQIAELKQKYKNNTQMLHKATMELYKKEGVNPFSGCLPMLLQMPVFFSLYPVVGRAFELRQAMFIPHWIEDLSRPDPFYILPIAMGISMFFQMKMTAKDPNQKPMLYMMPVMMVIMFANFSSGLTLYWFLFNIMSLMQQKIHR